MDLLDFFIFALQKQKNPPSEVTLANYKSDIKRFILWHEALFRQAFNPEDVSFHTLNRYKQDALSQNISARSFDRHLSSLRKFFGILTSVDYIRSNPFESLQIKKEINVDPWKLHEFRNSLHEVYKLSSISITNYISDIQQFKDWIANSTPELISPSALTYNVVNTYKNTLYQNPNLSPVSINRKLSSLRKYLSWLKDTGSIPKNRYYNIANIAENKPIPFSPLSTQTVDAPKNKPTKFNSIEKGATALIDLFLVNPIVYIFQTISFYVWQAKGQPTFYTIQRKTSLFPKSSNDTILGNLQKSSYRQPAAPFSVHSLPPYKKLLHHIRYTRPKWYRRYHSYAFVHYIHFSILLLCAALGAILAYQGFFSQSSYSNASPLYRTIPYQGTLLYSDNSPFTDKVAVRFSLYEDSQASGSALLWQEVQEVKTASNGRFRTFLGNSNPLPENLILNKPLWLGITVEDTNELKPRQQLPNVALAESSRLLNGLPVISENENNTKNVVLALDSNGDLVIGGNASPTFQATDGVFTLRGSTLSLQTIPGSRGNIEFSPDGTGIIDIQKPIQNTSYNNNLESGIGAVEIDDQLAVLATTSAQSAFVVNQNSTGPIISGLSNNIAKFSVDYLGNTTIGGNLLLQGGNASSSSSLKMYAAGDFTIQSLTNTIIDIGTSSLILSNKGLQTASFTDVNKDLTLSITGQHFVLANNNTFNIGGNKSVVPYNVIANSTAGASSEINSDQDLYIGGNVEIEGKLRLNNQTYSFPTNSGSNNYILSTNGSGELSWTDLANHPSNFLRQSQGATYLANNSADFLLGDSATASAKFSFTNMNSATPHALFTSLLTLNNPSGNTSDLLTVNSDIRIGTGTNGCVKNNQGSTIAGTCSSDERLKKNIAPITDVLSKLTKLTPSTYNWKTNEYPNLGFGSQTEYGLIAQQVEQVFPELVEQNGPNGFKAIHYERLPIFLLEGLKEQQQQIQSMIANLTVDSINVTTENITIAGKSFDKFLDNKLSSLFLTKDLTIGTKIVSPIIESNTIFTKTISPLASDTIIVDGKLAVTAQTTDQENNSIFEIRNASHSAVARFDGQGNARFAGDIEARRATIAATLTARDATISGTLRADRVIAQTIDGLDEKLSTLSANISNQNQTISSSSSQLTQLSQKLAEISSNPLETATASSHFANLDELSIPFGTFTQGLTALGASSFTDIAVSNTLVINRSLTISNSYINTVEADLELQPFRQAGVSFLSGLMRIDESGNLTLQGDATFNQNIAVRGTLQASVISPLSESDLSIRLGTKNSNSTESAKLAIENASGSAVLTIDNNGSVASSGSATFKELATNAFTLIRSAQADTSITETVASSSAGTAIIASGETERTILTPYVKTDSLIYLTAVSSSENVTPFLARQDEHSFTIRIPKRLYEDLKINWIIIN